MKIQHQTIPDEPQEAPVQPDRPEVRQPADPGQIGIPQERPLNEPQEVPERSDDSQEGEIPEEGDNAFIERAE